MAHTGDLEYGHRVRAFPSLGLDLVVPVLRRPVCGGRLFAARLFDARVFKARLLGGECLDAVPGAVILARFGRTRCGETRLKLPTPPWG